MVALGEELAKTLFQSLSENDVQRVTEEITRLGDVPAAVDAGADGVLRAAGDAAVYGARRAGVCAEATDGGLRAARAESCCSGKEGSRSAHTGDLAMLQKMEPQQLSKFLENEHPQTVALVLAHLDAKRGSTVLMNLQGAMRVEAVRRLAEMRQFSPEMAQKVALVLHRRMERWARADESPTRASRRWRSC